MERELALSGKVYLIGAGPGDPGLITVKGLRRLRQADVVVYDRLVDSRLLRELREGAGLVYVGKGVGERAMEQDEINRCLVAEARQGKVVARLKGGDPFVFGRGGEEALALAQAGIPFEVVPGVTSAIAAPAYAGIPVTHRDTAASFTVVTGSEDPSKHEASVRWDLLACSGGTLVLLMGWNELGRITRTLIEGGMEASTPVALVRWGTEPSQRVVTGTLEDVVGRGEEAGLTPPVVAVIGQVADLRREISWFDNRPLFGKRVLVTRSRIQASALSAMLADEGAEPVEVPTIEFLPVEDDSRLDSAIESLAEYGWVVFTSANGVEAFFRRMDSLGRDARVVAKTRVAAIGPATAEALNKHGISADLVPAEYVSEAVVRAMEAWGIAGTRTLLPRADIGREELGEGLARAGALVDQVPVYRTVTPEGSRRLASESLKAGDIDLVTFTSSSTVTNLLDLLDGDTALLERPLVACIGPITAATARDRGLRVDIEAREYTISGLVSAIVDHYVAREGE